MNSLAKKFPSSTMSDAKVSDSKKDGRLGKDYSHILLFLSNCGQKLLEGMIVFLR